MAREWRDIASKDSYEVGSNEEDDERLRLLREAKKGSTTSSRRGDCGLDSLGFQDSISFALNMANTRETIEMENGNTKQHKRGFALQLPS